MTEKSDSPGWLELALAPSVMRRACAYAVVVGAVLIAINHGDAILEGDVPRTRILKMLLTICVPYAVSTLSSVGALRGRGGRPDVPSPASHAVQEPARKQAP